VAAGAAHPFAERAQRCRDALAKGLEPWGKLIETDAGMTIAGRRRLTSNDPATLSVAGSCDWSDIAEAVARSGVPVLLFVGREDPRYPLVLSFAEQSGAKVIVLAEYDYATTVPAAGSSEIDRPSEDYARKVVEHLRYRII